MRTTLSLAVAIIVSLFGLTAPASAQGVSLAPEVGVNFTDFRLDPDLETEGREGLRAGLTVSYAFPGSDVFGLQSGAYFSQKGATLFVGDVGSIELDLDYLEFPLALVAQFPLGGEDVNVRFLGGGSLGLELSCDVRARGGTETVDCQAPVLREEDADFPTKTADFGLLVGGGIGLPVGTGQVTVDARYGIGLPTSTTPRTRLRGRSTTGRCRCWRDTTFRCSDSSGP